MSNEIAPIEPAVITKEVLTPEAQNEPMADSSFQWMVGTFKQSKLLEQLKTKGLADEKVVVLIAGVVGDLARKDEKRGLSGVVEDGARGAFLGLVQGVTPFDAVKLEEIWAHRPAIVPVLGKWPGVDVRALEKGWNEKASPSVTLRTEWEVHRKGVAAAFEGEEAVRKAKAAGVLLLPDLSSRFSSICETLRKPTACVPLFGGRALVFNQLVSKVEVDRKAMGDRTGEDLVSQIREHVETRLGVPREEEGRKWIEHISWPVDDTYRAVVRVAKDASYHPVRAHLNGLKWDGVKRLNDIARFGFGLDDAHPLEVKMTGWWFIQAVARMMEPGGQADYMLVLVADQGEGKSTRILNLSFDPSWVTDEKVRPGDKDNYLTLHMKWICEWGELAGHAKREAEEVKNFLTKRSDNFRKPYDRETLDHPRGFVFIGTTNDWEFLKNDPTGYRRYWPVRVKGEAGMAWMIANRDQIWAEAMEAYRKGERRWPDSAESRELAKYLQKYTKDILAPGEDDWVVLAAEAAYQANKGGAVQREDVMAMLKKKEGEEMLPEVRAEYRKTIPLILKKAGWRTTETTLGGGRRKGLVPPMARAEELLAHPKVESAGKSASPEETITGGG